MLIEPANLAIVVKERQSDQIGALLGLARESIFLSCFKEKIDMRTPKVFYSHADFATGRKVAILEDLSHVKQAGVYFGPGNPNNWGK
jgi:hypothetical protein